MRRFALMIVAAATAVMGWAEIPTKTKIYLDVTQYWCCHQSYYIYFSGDRTGQPNGSYRMTADPQHPGVYYYETKAQSQDNVRFCYSDTETASYVNSQVGTHTEDVNGFTTQKPYYVIDSDNGRTGHWAASPSSSQGVSFDGEPQVLFSFECADSLYQAHVLVNFTGQPCGLKVESPLLGKTITKALPKNPYELKLDTLHLQEGARYTLTISLCDDRACTQVTDSKELTLTVPKAECSETLEVDTCYGISMLLSSSLEGAESYKWTIDGKAVDTLTEQSLAIVTDSANGAHTYEVRAMKTSITAKNNLMANGGFEEEGGFSSDYTYVGLDQASYYTQTGHLKDNLYALTQDANYFWEDFDAVTAHGGQYFALFDAGKSGFAWKATSTENPSLIVRKDSTYYFSYWAANPKIGSTSPARLQFVISIDGGGTFENLGSEYELPADDNDWHLMKVTWTAPRSSYDVVIGVMDMNAGHDDNDFCLDDIMFQTTEYVKEIEAYRNTYVIKQHDCDVPPCTIPLYRKWDDFLHVDNSKSQYNGFQWYRNDQKIAGATLAYLDLNQFTDREDADEYFVLLSTVDGRNLESCHTSFQNAQVWQAQQKQVVSRRRIIVSTQLSVVVTTYDDGSVDTEKVICF